VVGHWGTTPGQNFIYVHLNRVIKKYDLDMFIQLPVPDTRPAIVGNVYLEGTWSEVYPDVTQDEAGMKKLFSNFLSRAESPAMWRRRRPVRFTKAANWAIRSAMAFGAAFDNPDLIVACVVGDGESRDRSLGDRLASSNKLLRTANFPTGPCPDLASHGYKISTSTVLSRIRA